MGVTNIICDDFRTEDEQPMEVDERRVNLKRKATDEIDRERKEEKEADDAGSSMEVSVSAYAARLEAIRLHRLKKEKHFRNKLKRFEKCCAYTGLSLNDIGWPLIEGKDLQKETPLTGFSFWHDESSFPGIQHPNWLLVLTQRKLQGIGAGIDIDVRITQFILQRTMRVLSRYCNWMYDSAIRKGRSHINHFDLQELLAKDEFRFHQYLHKFLVDKDKKFTEYNNEFFKYLHETYSKGPQLENIYSNPKHLEIKKKQSKYIEMYITMRYDAERTKELKLDFVKIQNLTFINQSGKYFSRFHAHRFHEALGMPPIEMEFILILDWLAILIMNQTVYKTCKWHDDQKRDATFPDLYSYHMAMAEEEDPLFNLEIDHGTPPSYPDPEYQKVRRTPRDPTSFYRKLEFEEYKIRFMNNHFNTSTLDGDWLLRTCTRGR